MKAAKLLENVKETEERLSKIQVQGPGTTVPMNTLLAHVSISFFEAVKLRMKFVTTKFLKSSNSRDVSDIWLKQPGNESSEDEEGTEEQYNKYGDDEMEEDDFRSFVDKRHEAQIQKAKNNQK